jgi:hypothetical protein
VFIDTLEKRWLLSGAKESTDGAGDHGGACPCGFCGNDSEKFIQSAIEMAGGPEYQIAGRWNSTASGSTGTAGSPATLTWGFVADGINIPGFNGEPDSANVLNQRLNAIYGSINNWQPLFQQVFDRWQEVSGVTFVYVTYDDGAAFGTSGGVLNVRPDIRIGAHPIDGASGILAYNFYPSSGGDMVIDSNDLQSGGYMTNTSNNSRRLRNVVSHEAGHGIGFAHVIPVNQSKLMEPNVTTSFDGPQFDDILAIQRNYGDPFEKNGRNETPATASNLGSLSIGASTLVQQVSTRDSNDNDYYRINLAGDRRLSITLSPVGGTYNQGPQGGSSSSFNAAAQADLRLRIYAANGTTLLNDINTTGTGAAESISQLDLPEGDVVLRVTGSGSTQMYQLAATSQVITRGDMNNDGVINNLDIAPFVAGLTDPAAFVTSFGYSPTLIGDINKDGAFNNLDIAPFVALLTGGRPATATAPAPLTTTPSRQPVRMTPALVPSLFGEERLVSGSAGAAAIVR